MQTRPTKMIKLEEIFQPEFQMREVDIESDDFNRLKSSMEKDGLIQAIGVRKGSFTDKTTGKTYSYELIYGFHRKIAADKLGWTEIKCEIHPEDTSNSDVMNLRMIENLVRKEAKPKEYAKQLLRIMDENPGVPVESLLARFGINKTPSWVSQMLKLNRLTEKATTYLNDGRMNLTNAQLLASLNNKIQDDYIEEAVNLSTPEFRERIGVIKEKHRALDEGKEVKENPYLGSKIRDKKEFIKTLETLNQGINPGYLQLGEKPDLETAKRCIAWAFAMDAASIKEREDKKAQSKEKREAIKQDVDSLKSTLGKLGSNPEQLEKAKAALAAAGISIE